MGASLKGSGVFEVSVGPFSPADRLYEVATCICLPQLLDLFRERPPSGVVHRLRRSKTGHQESPTTRELRDVPASSGDLPGPLSGTGDSEQDVSLRKRAPWAEACVPLWKGKKEGPQDNRPGRFADPNKRACCSIGRLSCRQSIPRSIISSRTNFAILRFSFQKAGPPLRARARLSEGVMKSSTTTFPKPYNAPGATLAPCGPVACKIPVCQPQPA